jgi:hypothetical protein
MELVPLPATANNQIFTINSVITRIQYIINEAQNEPNFEPPIQLGRVSQKKF